MSKNKDIVFIEFFPENLTLIYNQKKTSTLRTKSQSNKIGMKKGQKSVMKIQDKDFLVHCHGLVYVKEVGGKNKVWKNEGFSKTNLPRFNETYSFLEGKIPLYYYTFELIDNSQKEE